ncbi:MAG: flippase [Candidatus Omnitrophota bacterium]
MSTIKNIAKNSAVIIFSFVLESFFNLIILTLAVRYFGKGDFGKLSFLAAFFFLMGSLDGLFIRPILVREIAREKDRASIILGNGIIIRVLFLAFAVILLWLSIGFAKSTPDLRLLAFFTSVSLLISSLMNSYETVFQINLTMWRFKIISLAGVIVTLMSLFTVVLLKGTLLHFNILVVVVGVITVSTAKTFSDKLISPKFEIDIGLWRRIFRESWPLLLSALFISIYHRFDQILLLRLKGPEEVGIYSAAVKLAEIFNIIPIALKISILPLLSVYFFTAVDNFRKTYELSFKFILIAVIPLALWVSLFSNQIIYVFYGAKFIRSGLALSFLIWAEVFVFLGVVNNAILVSSNKQVFDPLFTGVSAVLNVILNLLLIPKHGFMGAAVSSLVSYSAGPVLGYFIKATRPYSVSMLRYSVKPFFASGIMFLFIKAFRNSFWISFLISPIIYLVFLYITKGLNKSDLGLLKAVFVSSRSNAANTRSRIEEIT